MKSITNTDKSHKFTMHVEAQLRALEISAPEKARTLHLRFTMLRNGMVTIDTMSRVEKAITQALQNYSTPRH